MSDYHWRAVGERDATRESTRLRVLYEEGASIRIQQATEIERLHAAVTLAIGELKGTTAEGGDAEAILRQALVATASSPPKGQSDV